MGSRSRAQWRGGPTVRTTLGKSALENALASCVTYMQAEVLHRVQCPVSNPGLVPLLFKPEAIELARQAHHIVGGDTDSWLNYPIGNHVLVRVEWRELPMIPIHDRNMRPHVDGQSDWALYDHSPLQDLVPLMKVRDKVAEITGRWERCRAVVMWMDENITLGAMRHYLPGIMSLCKSNVPDDPPSRFSEPLGIAPWIPLIREAQETIAAAALLPSTAPATRQDKLLFTVSNYDETFTRGSDTIEITHVTRTYQV